MLFIINENNALSQTTEDSKNKFNIGVDIFNRYIWRGTDYGTSPSVQPSAAYNYKKFEIGVWGAYATKGGYSETDPYMKFTFKSLSFILTDYFIHNESYSNSIKSLPSSHFLHFNSKTTNHLLETSISYKNKKIPLNIYVGTIIYGNDRGWGYDSIKDVNADNYYSTYCEATYSFNCQNNDFDIFLGMTTHEGAYGNGVGIVNTGITLYKKIKVTDNFQIPVKTSVIMNPQSENLYFIIGFTF